VPPPEHRGGPTLADPARFTTARATLLIDQAMTWFIKAGGIGIIIAVFGIFVFIAWQVVPLFRPASVTPLASTALPAGMQAGEVRALLSDEWGELPIVVDRSGSAAFIPGNGAPPQPVALDLGKDAAISASSVDHRHQRLVLGTADGRLAVRTVTYQAKFASDGSGRRTITGEIMSDLTVPLGTAGRPLLAVGYGDGGERKVAVAIQADAAGRRTVLVTTLAQTRTLLGKGETRIDQSYDLTARISGTPERLLIDERADSVVVTTREGDLFYFFLGEDGFQLRQTLRPFEDQEQVRIASADYLLGDVSLVLTNAQGVNRIFSLYVKPGADLRTFGLTKELPRLPGGATCYAPSVRNKAFVISSGAHASLRYGTSASIRWEGERPLPIVQAAISGKYQRLFLLGQDGRLDALTLDDPHPESGFNALFGKIWYEGADQAKHDWQSTGGSDDFEPKFSMIPLLIGSFKGTCYALLFALPIAVLGAIYTAEFMHPRFKQIVKPVIEIMASLPSVVLGFLAAIWLAPALEDRVPSLLLVVISLPMTACLFGWWWSRLPMSHRSRIRPGYEFLAFMPLMLLTLWAAWSLGPALEGLLFSGQGGHGDFRQWWRAVTGLSYEQRNSLVVGVMMGFAVIPIIFTIAEDALTNVPPSLRSASLALGASRWQTAMRVVLPTASAGIFSALMIGFGRAIGETMIVVMATGNTPIMSMNIFDGMRTLSANIAVELPEAPQFSTLYRTLFLGALMLFLLTFLVNTAAEVLRQHLREKYKTV
jgi:phosphate transport system permease protein